LENDPLLSRRMTGDRLLLAASGAWTAVHAHKLEPVVESIEREGAGVRAVAVDMQSVVALASSRARSLPPRRRQRHPRRRPSSPPSTRPSARLSRSSWSGPPRFCRAFPLQSGP